MEKVTGVPGEHMTREQTLDGVEAIIGKAEKAEAGEAKADQQPEVKPAETPAPQEDEAKVAESKEDKK